MPLQPEYEDQVTGAPAAQSAYPREMSLLDVLIAVAARKKPIAKFTAWCAVIALAYCLLTPNWYTAKTTILPPQQTQSITNAMLSQYGGLIAGLTGKDLGKSQNDMFIGMMQSQSIQDNLVRRFNLQSVYKKKLLVDARKVLGRHSVIEVSKQGLIDVSVEDKDRQRAADIANGYIQELQELTGRLAIGEAGHRRLFFEQQLRKAKDDLSDAEVGFKRTQEKTGALQIDAQSRAIISSITQLKAEIAAKEVMLSAMRSFATEDNPDYKLQNEQLLGLRQQLAKLLKNSNMSEGDVAIPTTRIPEVGIEYLRRYRELKYQETLYELLAKQYEIAKVDEAKSAPVIQVVDPALPPERKSAPYRTLIMLAATLSGFAVAVSWALIKEIYARQREDPGTREKLDLLKMQTSLKFDNQNRSRWRFRW